MNLDPVNTLEALSQALRERRTEAGLLGPAELAKSVEHTRGSIARSTAYKLETGSERFSLASMCSYLRACGADDGEIEAWRGPYERAMGDYDVRGAELVAVPTAKQLAEMGSEQAGRLLSRIDLTEAADLLRRIDIKQAVVLLPEIAPNVAVALLAKTSRARRILLFENIASERGAELLAEMPMESAGELLDELDGKRAAELLAKMPRGRAAKLLDVSETRRAIRLLTSMYPRDAALLLGELDYELTIEVLRTAPPGKAAGVLGAIDREVAVHLLVDELTDERGLRLLSAGGANLAAGLINGMPPEVTAGFMTNLPASKVKEMFGALDYRLQNDLLENLLTSAQAALILTEVDLGENFGFIVDNIKPARLAEIVGVMQPHEQVLMLALARMSRSAVLDALPQQDAERIRVDLVPARLASHLGKVPPDWSYKYVGEMGGMADQVLAAVDSPTAIWIARGATGFEESATLLESVKAEHVASVLLSMDIWEAARVVTLMSTDLAAAAIAVMTPEIADRIISRVAQNAEDGEFGDKDLPPDEFAEVRASRRKAAEFLRDAVNELRQTS